MTKILIIGCKGFIGSNTFKILKAKDKYEVWGCDIKSESLISNYICLNEPISNYHQIFANLKFDICINCAGAANVSYSFINPIYDYELNVHNVFRILDAIKSHNKLCKYINLSSAAVYGNPKSLPIQETHSINPISPYGQHKYLSEQICREFYSFFGIKTCSLRIFSVYGIGSKKQLLWDIYKKSRNASVIQLYGTGGESRDYIHVIDLVQVIELIIHTDTYWGEVVNVANGEEIFIKDIAKLFCRLLQPRIAYKFTNRTHEGHPKNWVSNIDKIKKIGYKSKISFEEGVESYIQWIEELGSP